MSLSKILLIIPLLIISSFSIAAATPPAITHTQWDELLKKYVSEEGNVNYKGFVADKTQLEQYLNLLSTNRPSKDWTRDEQLAYWINAYNAFTVKLIVDHYPVKSIKDIKNGIPFINSVWDIKFFTIGGKKMTLNDIEHGIIRKEFKEPRIHFAVNCASFSCPVLLNEAFIASKLDAQLSKQTKIFLNDTRKNQISANKIVISKIFNWYSTDFTNKGFFSRLFGKKNRGRQFVQFIAPYVTEPINKDAKVEYMDYDWSLNEGSKMMKK